MATVVTRAGKGSALTHAEMDANFNNLNNDKLETSGGTLTGTLTVNNDTGTDAVYSESGIDVSSGSAETFNIQNSGAGAMTLQVDGVDVITTSTGKPLSKDWGVVTSNTQIDLDDADFHQVECGANLTLTFASANTLDRATVAIHNNGSYTIGTAGIDNNDPTLTVGTNVQDIIGLVKSHGKITTVGLMDNVSAV